MQRRSPISDVSLPIAIFVKLFISALLTIVVAATLVFVTTTPSGKLKLAGTPRPTQTRVIKTPFSLFAFNKPTATRLPTNIPTRANPPTAAPANTQPVEFQPTIQPSQPTETPLPIPTEALVPTTAAAANITTLQGGIQIPSESFRADNLAFMRLVGQLGKGRINQVLWSPGASTANLVAATTGGFFYLDAANGTESNSVYLTTGINSAAVSPDGNFLVSSGLDNTVNIWNYGTNQGVTKIETQGIRINALIYSPDGTSIAGAGADGNIYQWNAADGSLIHVFEGTGSPIRALQISPDGQLLVAGYEDKTISLWNVASGVRFISITAHYKPVNSISISPDSKIVASSSDDGTFILWDTTNGKQIRLTTAESGVKSLTFTRDGTGIVTGEQNGTINLWDVATGNLNKTLGKVPGEVNTISYNPDSSFLAIGANTLHLWREADDTLSTPFKGFTYSTTSIAFNADASLLATGSQDGRITLWNPQTGEQRASLEGHNGNVTTLDFSPDGRLLASGGADNTILVWDIASGQKVYVIRGHSGGVRSVAFNVDGTRLASTGGWVDITLKMWDMATGLGMFNITGFSKGDIELALRKGTNMLASAGGDGIIRVWDFNSRELLSLLERHSRAIRSINFSPDGTMMASSSEDGNTYLWETTGWTLVKNLQTKGSNDLAYSMDNLVLAVGGEGIEFWDTSSGNLMTEISGTPGALTKLAVTFDGNILAAGSTDGTIRLFGIIR